MWFSLPFLYLFLHGYCYMTYLTLQHDRATRGFKDQGTPTMRLATGPDETAAELGT
jgi:cytolysin (calcineurin-like family phosphatase)